MQYSQLNHFVAALCSASDWSSYGSDPLHSDGMPQALCIPLLSGIPLKQGSSQPEGEQER